MPHDASPALPGKTGADFAAIGGVSLHGDLHFAVDTGHNLPILNVGLGPVFQPNRLPNALDLAVPLLAIQLRLLAVIFRAHLNDVFAFAPQSGDFHLKIGVAALVGSSMRPVDIDVRLVIDGAKAQEQAVFLLVGDRAAVPADAGDVLFHAGKRAYPGKGHGNLAVVCAAVGGKRLFCFLRAGGE